MKYKKGDATPNGLIFLRYSKGAAVCVTPAQFQQERARAAAYAKAYYTRRGKEIRARSADWARRNRGKANRSRSAWAAANREKRKAIIAKSDKKHRAARAASRQARRHADPVYAAICRVRRRTRRAFLAKGLCKPTKTLSILGCSATTLWAHIQAQFTPGMNLAKFLSGEIHIDHILPLSSAKTPAEVEALGHYTNLQPLWAADNLKKSDRRPLLDKSLLTR